MDAPSVDVLAAPIGAVAEGPPKRPVGPPMILQVSPLPGSTDREEYFYDPSADVDRGNFTAAQAFFLAQGHTVTIHDCANIAEFGATLPPASRIVLSRTFRCLSSPRGMLFSEHSLPALHPWPTPAAARSSTTTPTSLLLRLDRAPTLEVVIPLL
jgi:hypothetical protein